MEKTMAVATIAFVLVFLLFCTQQRAEAECLLPPHTRPYYESFTAPVMNQTGLDEIGSLCEQGPGSQFSVCCPMIRDWVNLTCSCSHGSGHVVPQSILTSAGDFCKISIPQVGQCEGHCGSKQSSLQELEEIYRHEPIMESIIKNGTTEGLESCCGRLHGLDWDCLCSPACLMVGLFADYSFRSTLVRRSCSSDGHMQS